MDILSQRLQANERTNEREREREGERERGGRERERSQRYLAVSSISARKSINLESVIKKYVRR